MFRVPITEACTTKQDFVVSDVTDCVKISVTGSNSVSSQVTPSYNSFSAALFWVQLLKK